MPSADSTAIILALIALLAWQSRQAAKERASLCQRIQSPERAVTEYALKPEKLKPPVTIPVDDDEAFRRAQGRDDDIPQPPAERTSVNGDG